MAQKRTQKRKTPKRKTPKKKTPKRKNPKRKTPKRKTPKRKRNKKTKKRIKAGSMRDTHHINHLITGDPHYQLPHTDAPYGGEHSKSLFQMISEKIDGVCGQS
jgi:hypothetical protein